MSKGNRIDAETMSKIAALDGAEQKEKILARQKKKDKGTQDPDTIQTGTSASSSAGQKTSPARYVLGSLDEFSNGKPQSYYLKDICPKSGLGQIMGASGAAKSFLALDLAYAIAIGRNWFKWTFSRTARQNLPLVAFLCLEGSGGFRQRIKALLQRERKNPDNSYPDPDNFVLCDEPFNICQMSDRDSLVWSLLDRAGERGIVLFIDTQAQIMGALDENSAQDMGAFLKCVDELQRRLSKDRDCFVWLICHMGKSGDIRQGGRGWSGVKAPMDRQIAVEYKSKVRTFTIVKNKDGRDGITCSFFLQETIIGKDIDGDEIRTCTVEPLLNIDAPLRLTQAEENGIKWLRDAYSTTGKIVGKDAIPMKAWVDACRSATGFEYKKAKNKIDYVKPALQEKELILCGANANADVILTDKSEDV